MQTNMRMKINNNFSLDFWSPIAIALHVYPLNWTCSLFFFVSLDWNCWLNLLLRNGTKTTTSPNTLMRLLLNILIGKYQFYVGCALCVVSVCVFCLIFCLTLVSHAFVCWLLSAVDSLWYVRIMWGFSIDRCSLSASEFCLPHTLLRHTMNQMREYNAYKYWIY